MSGHTSLEEDACMEFIDRLRRRFKDKIAQVNHMRTIGTKYPPTSFTITLNEAETLFEILDAMDQTISDLRTKIEKLNEGAFPVE